MKVQLFITFMLLFTMLLPASIFQGSAQSVESFRIYDSSGRAVTLDEVVDALGSAEVVLVGETHNDAVGHAIELQLLRGAAARYGQGAQAGARREVTLSLEMFERDVQTTLDEYLDGLILERQFLTDSRPWNNYQPDYRPLIEFARENGLPVVAANVPTRYANRVARLGRASLTRLSPQAKAWIAPLPYGEASAEYAAKFGRAMEEMPGGHEGDAKQNFLDAQVLRDATMAYAISQTLTSRPKALVLHVTGIFHVEGRMGIPEQLEKYRPRTRMIVVVILPAADAPKLDAQALKKSGDFIFITGAAQP